MLVPFIRLGLSILIMIRLLYVIHRSSHPLYCRPLGPLSAMMVLGSGLNQDTVLLLLLIILEKAKVLENSLLEKEEVEVGETSHFLQIYRSLEVGQLYITSVGTTLIALTHVLWLMIKIRPQVVFGIRWSSVFYVESVAHVRRPSLSGLLLYKLQMADRLFVQWPQLKSKYPRANYVGRLM